MGVGALLRQFICTFNIITFRHTGPGTMVPDDSCRTRQNFQSCLDVWYRVRCRPPSMCQFSYSRLSLSRIPRDNLKYFEYIHTSTYQICRIEEKLIRLTTFNKYMCNWTLEIRDILKILWKKGEIAP